jgi:adenine-specific DNA-methyltransferase
MLQEIAANNVCLGKTKPSPSAKKFLSHRKAGPPETLWRRGRWYDKHRQKHLPDILRKRPSSILETEQLLQRVLAIASNPGDIILDPYLGPVLRRRCHKMNRTYWGAHQDSLRGEARQVIAGEEHFKLWMDGQAFFFPV